MISVEILFLNIQFYQKSLNDLSIKDNSMSNIKNLDQDSNSRHQISIPLTQYMQIIQKQNDLNLKSYKSQFKSQSFNNFKNLHQKEPIISASFSNTCIINLTGKLKCNGSNSQDVLNIPKMFQNNTIQVSVGYFHSCAFKRKLSKNKDLFMIKGQLRAIKDNSTLETFSKCWGNNLSGGLDINTEYKYHKLGVGRGQTCGMHSEDQQQYFLRNKVLNDKLQDQRKFQDQENKFKFECFGMISYFDNQIDLFDYLDIADDQKFDIDNFYTGIKHLFIIKNSKITCTGSNEFGECLTPNIPPNPNLNFNLQPNINSQLTPASSNFLTLTAGDGHSCGLLATALLLCWGNNFHNQATVPVTTLNRPIYFQLQSGSEHNCAMLHRGFICWGNNRYRQSRGFVESDRVSQVVAGSYHNCSQETKEKQMQKEGNRESDSWDGRDFNEFKSVYGASHKLKRSTVDIEPVLNIDEIDLDTHNIKHNSDSNFPNDMNRHLDAISCWGFNRQSQCDLDVFQRIHQDE